MLDGRKILVLGIGNILNSDEGVGVHAVQVMQAESDRLPAVDLVDGGTLGLSLLPWVESASHLLILDAVDGGQPPGTVIELLRHQIPVFANLKLSQHQMTFQEVLGLAQARDKLPPQLHLVGVQPASLETGVELSPQVAASLTQMVDRAWTILSAWVEDE